MVTQNVSERKYLNKYSNLETGFYINMVAIADGKPKQLSLKEILEYYSSIGIIYGDVEPRNILFDRNTGDIKFQIPSIPGEYIITCNFHAYPRFGQEQDILLTTKVIVKEK